ncbi:hypothetical protein D9M68_890560 [compost metagenome]
MQLGWIGTGGGFAVQALLDKTEHQSSDFFRAEVITLATQGPGLQPQALGQAIGQDVLRIRAIACSRQVIELRGARSGSGQRGQSVHGKVPGQDI